MCAFIYPWNFQFHWIESKQVSPEEAWGLAGGSLDGPLHTRFHLSKHRERAACMKQLRHCHPGSGAGLASQEAALCRCYVEESRFLDIGENVDIGRSLLIALEE